MTKDFKITGTAPEGAQTFNHPRAALRGCTAKDEFWVAVGEPVGPERTVKCLKCGETWKSSAAYAQRLPVEQHSLFEARHGKP